MHVINFRSSSSTGSDVIYSATSITVNALRCCCFRSDIDSGLLSPIRRFRVVRDELDVGQFELLSVVDC